MVTVRKEFVKGIRAEKALENTDFQDFPPISRRKS